MWVSDGSEHGTFILKDINFGTIGSFPNNKIISNGFLFFSAVETATGRELYKSDGTTNGTTIVKDIRTGMASSFLNLNLIFNNELIFNADNGISGNELWKSNGSNLNTILLKDIYLGFNSSNPNGFKIFNNQLFFNANNGIVGNEIWLSNGTTTGTKVLKDLNKGFENSNPIFLGIANQKLFFRATVIHDNKNYGLDFWAIGNCNNINLTIPNLNNSLNYNFEIDTNQPNKTCHCDIYNNLIVTFNSTGLSPLDASNTSSRVWNDNNQDLNFVKRHYEIIPQLNPNSSTGKVALYFNQEEFDGFNNLNLTDLPINPSDSQGKANLRIVKYSGASSDGSGLPNSYSGNPTIINPADEDIIWNETAQRWEVTFDTVGFGGFFVRSGAICTTTKSGQWDDPTVWSCGAVPSSLDDVIIATSHNITMPVNYTGQANNLENIGTLTFSDNANLTLTGQ